MTTNQVWDNGRDSEAFKALPGAVQMLLESWQGFSCHKEWGRWARPLKQFSIPIARTCSAIEPAATQHV